LGRPFSREKDWTPKATAVWDCQFKSPMGDNAVDYPVSETCHQRNKYSSFMNLK
jgi:hypothetical protein